MGEVGPGEPSPVDLLRRKYLAQLAGHTNRATIVYATSWLDSTTAPPGSTEVVLGDVQGFMEACSNITENELDLLITSPGGNAQAAESIMEYLRTRFTHIRAVVPVAAMSAGTMMALSADEIVMGAHSQLGPIDPQITVSTPEGPRSAPAQSILDQFDLAKAQCADPANIGAWLPILRSYLPGLIAYCNDNRAFALQYAQRVLAAHMFKAAPDPAASAATAAAYFTNYTDLKSHGRRVSRDDARNVGLVVHDLEDDHELQDLVLSVHHTDRLAFGAGVHKIIENHHGRSFIQATQNVQIIAGPSQFGTPQTMPLGSPPIQPPLLRQVDPRRGQGGRPKKRGR